MKILNDTPIPYLKIESDEERDKKKQLERKERQVEEETDRKRDIYTAKC